MFLIPFVETNFYYIDEMRDYFDRSRTSRSQTDQLRDQMMEEYMLKKRMKKRVRNDYDEHDEFDTSKIITEASSAIGKKVIGLGSLGALVLFCLVNRRKGAGNPIILVKDDDYYEKARKNKRKKKKGKK